MPQPLLAAADVALWESRASSDAFHKLSALEDRKDNRRVNDIRVLRRELC